MAAPDESAVMAPVDAAEHVGGSTPGREELANQSPAETIVAPAEHIPVAPFRPETTTNPSASGLSDDAGTRAFAPNTKAPSWSFRTPAKANSKPNGYSANGYGAAPNIGAASSAPYTMDSYAVESYASEAAAPSGSFPDAPVAEATAAPAASASTAMASAFESETTDPLPTSAAPMPAGSHQTADGYSTVQVYYATDRERSDHRMESMTAIGQSRTFQIVGGLGFIAVVLMGLAIWWKQTVVFFLAAIALLLSASFALVSLRGMGTDVVKRGVTYTGGRGELVRGVCKVTVPDSHQRGQVERPSLLRFELREDARRHVVLVQAEELPADNYYEQLSRTVSQAPDGDLLLFIHGYNVDFESAVRRTAQIAVDLPFQGVPVCYSWPSQGTLLGYPVDENNVAWSTEHLKDYLLELCDRSGATSVNVVAHSMGNRALTEALNDIALERGPEAPALFDRVVMAAPDVDADRFRRHLASRLTQTAQHVTLYASSDDQALIASKKVHGYPRAGDAGNDLVVVPGVETVDVTGIDLSLLGHSYYGDSGVMLRDLFDLIHHRRVAGERSTVTPKLLGQLTYWQIVSMTANLTRGNTSPVAPLR